MEQNNENILFNEYQQTQYKRIREIKNEIRERARHFKEFSMNAKGRADQAEFECNMRGITPALRYFKLSMSASTIHRLAIAFELAR